MKKKLAYLMFASIFDASIFLTIVSQSCCLCAMDLPALLTDGAEHFGVYVALRTRYPTTNDTTNDNVPTTSTMTVFLVTMLKLYPNFHCSHTKLPLSTSGSPVYLCSGEASF